MASINKINVNSTTYTLRDSRIPDTNGSTTQYLRGDGTWATPTVSTISSSADVTDNDTYMTIEPGSITPTPTVNLQTKTGITPTTSSQTITPDSGYDGLSSVQINAMPAGTAGTPTATKGTVSNHSVTVTPSVTNTTGYITGGTKTGTAVSVSASELVSGNLPITENGTGIDVTNYETVTVNVAGSAMNVQTAQSTTRRSNTALGSITSLTCSKTGTYDVYWDCMRTTTSGGGSQLYIDGTAYGTENTAFSSYAQTNHLTGVAISANQTVAVYGRSRSGYYIYAPQLTIVQTA